MDMEQRMKGGERVWRLRERERKKGSRKWKRRRKRGGGNSTLIKFSFLESRPLTPTTADS